MQLDKVVYQSEAAFEQYKITSLAERAAFLRKIADQLEAIKEALIPTACEESQRLVNCGIHPVGMPIWNWWRKQTNRSSPKSEETSGPIPTGAFPVGFHPLPANPLNPA